MMNLPDYLYQQFYLFGKEIQRPKKLRDAHKATELSNSIAKNNTPVGLRAEFCPQLPFKSENIHSWGEQEVFYFFSSPFGVLTHHED